MSEVLGSKNIDKMQDFKMRREQILQMGGQKSIDERHEKGQMSARERIDYFFDPDTFTEIGLWVKHRQTAFGMDKKEIPAEGIITGFGKVNGRYVVAASEDYTSMAGTKNLAENCLRLGGFVRYVVEKAVKNAAIRENYTKIVLRN